MSLPPLRAPGRARCGAGGRALVAVALGALLLTACSSRRATSVQQVSVTRTLGPIDVQGPIGAWAPDPDVMDLLPVGQWIAVGDEVAYTYIDHSMGLSARILPDDGAVRIRRLAYAPAGVRLLEPAEVAERGLPELPDFVTDYGEQPEPGMLFGHWRTAEGLAHRWHPEYPDDLLVVLITEYQPNLNPEIIWVRVFDCDGLRCRGGLINQPHQGSLQLGDVVSFDASDVPPDRPPPAETDSDPLPSELRSALLTAPALANLVTDPRAWEADFSVPPSDRMPPIGRWFLVGNELSFCVLTEDGPKALRLREGGVMTHTMPWLPRGALVLTDEQVEAAELPKSLPLQDLPPQPAPGTWGSWRLREDLEWMFSVSGDVDVVVVLIDEGKTTARVRLTECEQLVCIGTLTTPVGEHKKGEEFEMGTISGKALLERGAELPFDPRAAEIPHAWPRGHRPENILDALMQAN